MSKMKFFVCKKWKGYHGETIFFDGYIEIETDVILAVNDEWRTVFYPSLTSPQKVAEHIAFNLIVNDAELAQLDGFANFPNEYANIVRK